MDQSSENLIIASDEVRDPGIDSQKGVHWPVSIVAGVLCMCAVILLWPTGKSNVTEAGGRLRASSASDPVQQQAAAQRQPITYYHQAIPGGLFSAPPPPT